MVRSIWQRESRGVDREVPEPKLPEFVVSCRSLAMQHRQPLHCPQQGALTQQPLWLKHVVKHNGALDVATHHILEKKKEKKTQCQVVSSKETKR